MSKCGSQSPGSFAVRKFATASLEDGSSNEAKSEAKFTEGKGPLTYGAKIFYWWGNGSGWWGFSPPLCASENAMRGEKLTIVSDNGAVA